MALTSDAALFEMLEAGIVACLYVSLALGCLEIDVEVAVIHLIGSHILHAFFADDGIILRAPGDEIF